MYAAKYTATQPATRKVTQVLKENEINLYKTLSSILSSILIIALLSNN